MIKTRKRSGDKNNTQNHVSWNTIDHQRLVKAFAAIDSPDLARLFLDDLMTPTEIETCARRFSAVEWLMRGAPYEAVTQLTGVSPKVIARLTKQLLNKRGGFWEIMSRLYPRGLHYSD